MECTVKLFWDNESFTWHCESNDERVRTAAPEMLELNRGYKGTFTISFETVRVDKLELTVRRDYHGTYRNHTMGRWITNLVCCL